MSFTKQNLIVCGTDTDVGKTVVSALLVQGLESNYWKPIQSGLSEGSDTDWVCKILKLPKHRYLKEIYRFQAPVSPHWAAEKENCSVSIEKLKLPEFGQQTIIETAGGLMVPLRRDFLQLDLLEQWQLPVVLVARSGLGTINHTLLSLEALKRRKLPIVGVILNGPLHADNPKTIHDFGGVPILAELPKLSPLTSETLQEEWQKQKLIHRIKSRLQNLII